MSCKSFFEKFIFLFIKLTEMVNWRLVKRISELKILTIVSYSMLLFVALLAGVWPSVRVFIEDQERKIHQLVSKTEEQQQLLVVRTEELNKKILLGESKEVVNEHVDLIGEQFMEISSKLKLLEEKLSLASEKAFLPKTWAVSFFASLFVVIAHLIYQVFVPNEVRNYSYDNFVKMRIDMFQHKEYDRYFKVTRLLGNSLIGKTHNYKEALEIKFLVSDLQNIVDDEDLRATLITFAPSQLIRLKNELPGSFGLKESEIGRRFVNRVITIIEDILNEYGLIDKNDYEVKNKIAASAEIEYLVSASSKMYIVVVNFCLYLVSIYLVLMLIYTQSIKVLSSSGMSSILQLFYF